MASNIGDSLSSENRSNVEAFKQGWYGEEYQDKTREEAIREKQTNPDNVQYLRERTSDYRQIIKEVYPEYARYGCSNIEDFWAAYQLEEAGASRNSAISTYRLAQRVGDISKSPDLESKWEKKLDEEFGKTSIVKTQQKVQREQFARQYELEKEKAESEYKEQRKKIENSRRRGKEEEYKKIEEQRDKTFELLKEKYQAREQSIRIMPNQITKSALDSVKQFYRNK